MFKLGITGGMGSGKSTAAHFFKLKGAKIFDADKEAKRLILSRIDLQKRIIDTFGTQVIRKNHLDLTKLAKYIFSKNILFLYICQIYRKGIFLINIRK